MNQPDLAPLRLRPQGVAWREVEGEVVVLDVTTSQYLQVNEAGSLLFPLLADGTTREQLEAALQEKYELPAEQATRDVDAFMTMLQELNLLAAPA